MLLMPRGGRYVAAAGGGGFVPTDLGAKLFMWYDLTDTSSLFTNSARTTPVTTNGDLVRGVLDKSGNARHMARATGDNTWDATNGQVTLSGTSNVCYLTDTTQTGMTTTMEFFFSVKVVADTKFLFASQSTGKFIFASEASGSSATGSSGSPTYMTGLTDNGVSTRQNSLDAYNTSAGLVAGVRAVDASGWTGTAWGFFAFNGGADYQTTGAAKHIVVTTALTAGERSDLITYLLARVPA